MTTESMFSRLRARLWSPAGRGALHARAALVAAVVAATLVLVPAEPASAADPPQFTTHPADTDAAAGQTVTLTVEVTGSPRITWEGGGPDGFIWSTVPDQTSTTLRVPMQTFFDGHMFRAVATNEAGTVRSNPARLTLVSGAPQVTVQPVDQALLWGDAISITADVTGYPRPSVSWQQFDGTTWVTVPNHTSTTFSVASASSTHDGMRVRAVFTNTHGTAHSNPVLITVFTSAPRVVVSPRDADVTSGTAVTLSAAGGGVPAPSVQWQFAADGATWADIAGATVRDHTFSAHASTAGAYRAVFSNVVGTATTDVAVVAVTMAPGVPPDLEIGAATHDGFEVLIVDHSHSRTYAVATTEGVATRTDGMILITGLAPGADATVTVTASTPHTLDASASITGSASPAPPAVVVPDPAPPAGAEPPHPEVPSSPAELAEDTPTGFVHRLYWMLFGRVGEPAGVAYWTSALDGGASTSWVVSGFMGSAEWRAVIRGSTDAELVELLYSKLLGRRADAAGAAYWIDAIVSGRVPRSHLVTQLINSPELGAALRGALEVGRRAPDAVR